MSATLSSNSTGDKAELDITVETDQGLFLGFSAIDEDGEEVFDLILEGRQNINEFFAMVDKVRREYERQAI